MPIFRKILDRKLERAADDVIKQLDEGNSGESRHGSAILTWILMQIVFIVVQKLLERIIRRDGEDVVKLAETLLEQINEERRSPFGDEE